jgi:hypothetical protein
MKNLLLLVIQILFLSSVFLSNKHQKLLNLKHHLDLLHIKHQRLLGVLLNPLYPLDHLPSSRILNPLLEKHQKQLVFPNLNLKHLLDLLHIKHQRLLGVLLNLLYPLDHLPNPILRTNLTNRTNQSLRLYLFLCRRILMTIVL